MNMHYKMRNSTEHPQPKYFNIHFLLSCQLILKASFICFQPGTPVHILLRRLIKFCINLGFLILFYTHVNIHKPRDYLQILLAVLYVSIYSTNIIQSSTF